MTGAAAFRSTLLAGLGGAWSRRCAAALAAVTLVSCAGSPDRPSNAQSDERRLFVETDESILEYHIQPVQPEQLALTGLARLDALDPQLSIEHSAGAVVLHVGDRSQRFDAPGPSELVDWGVLTSKMLDEARTLSPQVAATPADKLEELVIDGSLAELDPYSRYVPPDVAREHRATRDGFGGIGVTLDIHENDVRIAGVMPDTPAATAGLVPGDRIVSLDGVPVEKLSPEDIRKHLRGPVQTMVQLAVARSGIAEPLKIAVQRTRIVPETVSLKERGDIAWLKVTLFNQETGERLAELLKQAHHEMGDNLRGIVLDLRDNPGGLLDQSVDVVSLFIQNGDVLSTIGRNPGAMQHFTATGDRYVETAPMAVLVNGGSASASEIVASALQDSGRAVVIGTSSYGKGTVQTVIRTSNDGELTVTWAQIITAGGYQLNTHGVVPTVCTSQQADTAAEAATLLPVSASPVQPALARARVSLDDQAWQHMRSLCPAQREKSELDELVAQRLLDTPSIYHAAMASMEPGSAARLAAASTQR
ncbi:MAG TPA: S41 family peptidase [Stellaceae bacterium]|jgi:carboxyl-terminal processing protease|nr:S41 family peptidase [Stellaceae bacterium]